MATSAPSDKANQTDENPPLTSRMSTEAPQSEVKILSRSSPSHGIPTYTLQIGKTAVPSVTPSEIFDYVSAHDLEVFENQTFEREIAETEARQKERLAAKAQLRRLNKPKAFDSSSDASSVSGASTSGGDEIRQTAAGGRRQRPTYTHFYPKQRAPRGSAYPTSTTQVAPSRRGNDSNSRDNKRRRVDQDSAEVVSAQDAESVYSAASPQPTQPPSAMEQAAGLIADVRETESMDLDNPPDQDIDMPIRQQQTAQDTASSSDSDSDGSEVYSVEKILAHNYSDPRSHDAKVHGEKPVMLYQVKWEGYDETTWEPASSFADKEVLHEYWAQHNFKQKRQTLPSRAGGGSQKK